MRTGNRMAGGDGGDPLLGNWTPDIDEQRCLADETEVRQRRCNPRRHETAIGRPDQLKTRAVNQQNKKPPAHQSRPGSTQRIEARNTDGQNGNKSPIVDKSNPTSSVKPSRPVRAIVAGAEGRGRQVPRSTQAELWTKWRPLTHSNGVTTSSDSLRQQ